MNKRIKELKLQEKYLKDDLDGIRLDIIEAYSQTFLTCNHCGKKSRVGGLLFVNYERWKENTGGSPCGGYYEHGSYWECQKCGEWKRNEFGRNIRDQEIPIESFKKEITYK